MIFPSSVGRLDKTLFFMQNFNEMFMFVGELHDFIDVTITSPGNGT